MVDKNVYSEMTKGISCTGKRTPRVALIRIYYYHYHYYY